MSELAVWQRTIVDEEGNIVPLAEVEVRHEHDDSLATIYADRDGETELDNPLTADTAGFARFYAEGGAYKVTATGAGSEVSWRFVAVGLLAERDKPAFDSVADVENSRIHKRITALRTNGYYDPGDGGGALYIRVASEPDHAGKIQSAGGAWWELAEDVIRPQMFGARGDGTTDDQGAIETTVNFALLTGAEVHWPSGEYISTESIPQFHDVQHTGPGVIRRGGHVWYITPAVGDVVQENSLYYAVNGDDLNDGIDPDNPRRTRSRFRADLYRLSQQGKLLGGSWYFQFGEGEWDESRLRINFEVPTLFPINIVGAQGDRGQEVVSYGNFGKASAWRVADGTVTIADNEAVFVSGAFKSIIQSVPDEVGLEAGESYEIAFTVADRTAGTLVARLGASSGTDVPSSDITTNGQHTVTLEATADSDQIRFTANPDFDGTLKDVSVRKITPDGEGAATTVWKESGGAGQIVLTDSILCNVDNIRLKGNGESSTTYGWATEAHGSGKVTLTNCEAEDASIGFAMFRGGSFELSQCQARRCSTGYRAHYGTTINLGRSLLGYNRAIECDRGAHISRNAIGHADYLVVEDADVAVLLDEAAPRVNFVETNFRRCAVGVDAQDNSGYLDQGINFNIGTEDACEIPYRNSGGSMERRLYGIQSQTERRIGFSFDELVLTTSNQQIRIGNRSIIRLPAGHFSDPSKRLRVVVRGTKTGTAGSAAIDVGVRDHGATTNWQRVGGATVGINTEGGWEMEFNVTPVTLTSQMTFMRILRHSGDASVGGPFSSSADLSDGDKEITVQASKGDAADDVRITSVEAFLMG